MQTYNLQCYPVSVMIQSNNLHNGVRNMPDYKAMYLKLFNRVSDAIEILQQAQREGEDTYITDSDEPTPISLETATEAPDENATESIRKNNSG